MEPLSIRQLAALTGVSVNRIRYYERKRLLGDPVRLATGLLAFPPGAADKVRFIQSALRSGFRSNEIAAMLADGSRAPRPHGGNAAA